jgi:hypothetical protein
VGAHRLPDGHPFGSLQVMCDQWAEWFELDFAAGGPRRMGELLDVDPERVRLWLFARCVQESLHDLTMREPARELAR